MSSSVLLYSQHFGQCMLWFSSDVACQIWEPTQNFEPNPLFNPCGVDHSNFVNYNQEQVLIYSKYSLLFLPIVRIEPATSRSVHL